MRSKPRHGFTLIELLVVVSIVALLIALLLPGLGQARASARAALCGTQLRQCYVGVAAYANDMAGHIPANNTGAGNWHYRLGGAGYLGSGKLPPWPVLRCPSEYDYQSNNGLVRGNYNSAFMGSSYAISFSFSYYQTHQPRKAFFNEPDFARRSEAPMFMDCPAWNIGWNAACFDWHVDDLYWAWEPFYPYRHAARTANVAYLDGHVGRVKSFVLGEGPRLYVNLYRYNPDGTLFP